MKDRVKSNSIKYILVSGLFLWGFLCCSPPKYIVKKQFEIINLDLDNSIVNYIPIPDNELQISKLLDSSYHLLLQKKYSKLDKYLRSKETAGIGTPDLFLSKTLLLITKKEYPEAVQSLMKINDLDYPMLKKLLTLDLNYEISRVNGNFNYNRSLKDYQSFIDSNPDEITLKKIILIRMRYLRYNY